MTGMISPTLIPVDFNEGLVDRRTLLFWSPSVVNCWEQFCDEWEKAAQYAPRSMTARGWKTIDCPKNNPLIKLTAYSSLDDPLFRPAIVWLEGGNHEIEAERGAGRFVVAASTAVLSVPAHADTFGFGAIISDFITSLPCLLGQATLQMLGERKRSPLKWSA